MFSATHTNFIQNLSRRSNHIGILEGKAYDVDLSSDMYTASRIPPQHDLSNFSMVTSNVHY